MARHSIGARLLLVLVSTSLTLGLVEIAIRLWRPGLSGVSRAPFSSVESPFRFDDRIGYELRPYAVLGDEVLNSDGFRGPERAVPKPAGVYRILAIGDSTTEASEGEIPYEQTWEARLEHTLNSGPAGRPRTEVIDAGVSGFVSWQALVRLRVRGLKYQPDVVVVLVGWNDLINGWDANWYPRFDLRAAPGSTDWRPAIWRAAKQQALAWSYIARLLHDTRIPRRATPVNASCLPDRRAPFNAAALEQYVLTLEEIRETASGSGAATAIVAFPTFLTQGLCDELRRSATGPSIGDYADAIERYRTAIRSLASRHADVTLIDAAADFGRRPIDQQARLFIDSIHLSPEGYRELAGLIEPSLPIQKTRGQ